MRKLIGFTLLASTLLMTACGTSEESASAGTEAVREHGFVAPTPNGAAGLARAGYRPGITTSLRDGCSRAQDRVPVLPFGVPGTGPEEDRVAARATRLFFHEGGKGIPDRPAVAGLPSVIRLQRYVRSRGAGGGAGSSTSECASRRLLAPL